ncbi:methyltransferase, partial [Lysobacter sp. 2RAB21]
IEGDTDGFKRRPAKFYRERFAAQGFAALGSHLWLGPMLRGGTAALETAD